MMIIPKPFGSEPDKVEKQVVGLRGMDSEFPESLPSSAVIEVGVGESPLPNPSIANTKTPEVWFAQNKDFVDHASAYQVVHAFCVEFGIKKIPVESELNKIDSRLRPFEICSQLYQSKES